MRALRQCDILDDPADALVCSTNVLLNCTGGVGGALLMRYGSSVQAALHGWLASRGQRFASQGDVIDLVPPGLPYRHLLHTLPCDGMYDTSPKIVAEVFTKALGICASDPCVHRVAVSALATGYGHLPFDDFLPIAAGVMKLSKFDGIREIVLCLQDDADFNRAKEINRALNLELELIDHGARGSPARDGSL
jgi:O-acetyl-ADP-ribose deacetylase (regulator of RNase III)